MRRPAFVLALLAPLAAQAAPETLSCQVLRSCMGEDCTDNGLTLRITLDTATGRGAVQSLGEPVPAALSAVGGGVSLVLTNPASVELLTLSEDRTWFVMSSHEPTRRGVADSRLAGPCMPAA